MTKTVRQIAEEIVAREGGYVNDPDDPGGATNHGVTIGTMRRLGLDLTGDGKVSVADVKALTRAQAVEIYIKHYFEKPGISKLPEVLHASVFDMYVNAGTNAVTILQRMLANLGFPCDADGAIGPQTIRAAQMAYEAAPKHLADAYGIARRNYYYALADRRPASRKYVRRRDGGKGGWITRAEEFISPKYHLTQAQHEARLAGGAATEIVLPKASPKPAPQPAPKPAPLTKAEIDDLQAAVDAGRPKHWLTGVIAFLAWLFGGKK